MKKVLSIALALLLVIGLVSFAKPASADAEEITLWTYPIGNWGNEETVKALSRAKAEEVAALVDPDALVIAADTIVWLDGEILGKPHSEEQAFSMLRHLSGRDHEVYTGVTVLDGEGELCEAERSVVHFRKLSDEEIRHYIATGEPMDKAGAYGAQGKGALFVRAIEGDFFNVMGLPVCRLGQMLAKKGVPIL